MHFFSMPELMMVYFPPQSSQTSDLKDAKKMFKNKLFKSKKNKNKQASKKRYTEIPPDQQSVASGVKDYEGIGDDENEMYSEPSNYQVGSEYSEDASSVIQNNKSVEYVVSYCSTLLFRIFSRSYLMNL